MITVSVWHNVATDAQGRHTGMLDGYQPGNPMVCVFAYQAGPAGRSPEAIAEEAFTFNDHPRNPEGEELARQYYRHRLLRSLPAGDVMAAGEAALAVARPTGRPPVSGGLNQVRAGEHGTRPLPGCSRLPETGDRTAIPRPDEGAT